MHRQMYNDRNEFEPRITPQPVTKFDCVIAPSVPEVSLIFDKPGETKSLGYKSPSAPLERSKSYAEWREQNFSQRISNPYTDSAKIHRNESENTLQRRNPSPNIESPNRNNRTPKKVVDNLRKNEEYEKSYTDYRHVPANMHFIQQDCDRNHITQQYNASVQNDTRVPQSASHSTFTSPSINKSQPPVDSIRLYKERQGLYSCSPGRRNLIVQKDRSSSDVNNTMNKLLSENPHLKPNTFPTNGYPPILHPTGHPYPYAEMNPCSFPPFYPALVPNNGIDNNETVKNLLQLVNSQSEQIKSLQAQIDRLLKMQEESLKERSRCSCSGHICQQTESGSYSTINASNTLVSQNQSVMRNTYQTPAVKQNEHAVSNEARSDNDVQMIQSELQSRKALLEQKVSIGVMTSFEFTVQNSPFLTESEDYEQRDLQQTDLIGKKNGFIYSDSSESLRRNKGSFPRAVSAALENIVEDSESHLSSSHQQSSNFNASYSTKDLQERQSHTQTLKESDASNGNYNQQSPRLHNTIPENSVQDKIASLNCREKCNEKEEMRHNKKNHLVHAGGRLVGESNKVNVENTKRHRFEDAQRDIVLKDSLNKPPSYHNRQNGKYNSNVQSDNCMEESLVLSGADLNLAERPPPTPDPSIHVDIKEYLSDDESDKINHSPKVGWTFYNNVLGQVNQILQNSQVDDAKEPKDTRTANTERNTAENKVLIDTVKNATLEQLRKLGISLCENTDTRDSGKKPVYDSSFYPRLDYQPNMTQGTNNIPETNTSMHMKALALKYLSDDQLADLAMQKQGTTSMKHLMLSNMQGTNMSFATMRYLERYQLLPGKNNVPVEENDKVGTVEPPKLDARPTPSKQSPALQRYPFTQTPRTTCPSKILDISTLKQQPKLL